MDMDQAEINVPELFDYKHPEVPSDCKYLVSPSMLHKLFDNPWQWYLMTVKGEHGDFHGNTATVIGTICHYIYHMNTVGRGEEVTREWIDGELLRYNDYRNYMGWEQLDLQAIMHDYPLVAKAVMNGYVIPANQIGYDVQAEIKVINKIGYDVYAGGTIDRVDGDCVVDFKTVSRKPDEAIIPLGYKLQLLLYAKMLEKQGKNINRIRIVYGVKPTKTIPARCYIVTEAISDENKELIDNVLTLVVDSIKLVESQPELDRIVFRDLNEMEKPRWGQTIESS